MWTPGAFPWPCRSPGRTSGRCRRWTAAVCCSIAGPWGRSAAASRSCTLRRNPWRCSQAGIPCWAAGEGCWLYLYGLQAPLPSLREAGEGVQEQYHALYQALYADPEELLSLWAEG